MAPLIEVTAFTHRGRVRDGNEDSVTVAGWVSDVAMTGLRRSRHELTGPVLCAVADGMGGHTGGEIASRYTVKRLAAEPFVDAEARAVVAAIAAINAELYQTMAADRSLRGMGTTVAGMLLSESRAIWFNVGDSRVYRVHEGALRQLSVDDVPPGPRSGLITQTLGGGVAFTPIEPHLGELDLTSTARWLICSDGLTDMIDDHEIARCLENDDERAGAALVEAAMVAGGHDNISIILVSVA